MTVVVNHSTPADGSFSSTGATAWNADHTLSGVGTMAEQNANTVAITGGTIDGATVGATTASTGAFTTVSFPAQGSAPATPATGFTQYASNTGMFSWKGTNGFIRQFSATSITADRTWTLPDASGTVALTSNLGTIASQNANAVAITGGTIDGTIVGATTAAAGTFTTLTATGQTSLGGAAGAEGLRVTTTTSGVNYLLCRGQISGNSPSIRGAGSDAAVSLFLGSQSTGSIRFLTNSLADEQLRVANTTNAVNYVQVTGNISGSSPNISAQGSDSSVDMLYSAKGTGGSHVFRTNSTTRQFQVNHAATVVNYATVVGAIAGAGPVFGVAGTDADIDLNLTPKGAGNVRFGTYTASALLAVAGYITIKDSGGTSRRLLVG